ncbi:MAG: cardiolipin synthase [Desulfobacterales bacterium SG8_35]|nr:MAG: cardiolipin synthase [Desulfobacterales bacterium SG8_35]
MSILDFLRIAWPHLATLAIFLLILATAVHILYKKRDTRAAAGWLGLVWFAPVLGVCLYWMFGVNRIKRRAKLRFADKQNVPLPELEAAVNPQFIEQMCGAEKRSLVQLSRMTDKLTRQPLMQGNRITPLINGDQAYPRMLSSIEAAQHSVSLCSYIFDNDSWGKRFRAALRDAGKRGVEVKVLIDGMGARYSFPPITWGLRRHGIEAAEFMKTILPWRFRYLNLRNHRKIMVIDGSIGFTGGMNIRRGNCLADNPSHPVQDLHFLINGPVVAELQRSFAEDWTFTTGQVLEGEKWYPHLDSFGNGVARGISDGPDEDFDKLRMVILAALATAQESIKIITPYFLPDGDLVSALCIAALRGVDIEILLPAVSNLRMVKWASDAGLEELLREGCRIFLTQPPFDHSKIMVVDHAWVLLGSANWDARSLALNFEFNVESYDFELAESMETILQGKKAAARELTLQEILSKSLTAKLRNRFFRLFSPYL